MKIILVGYGNVGKEIHEVLSEQGLSVDFVVRTGGIYNSTDSKLDGPENFHKYVDKDSVVFISTPSVGKGELSAKYYKKSLEAGAKVITCEKAFLPNNWNVVLNYPGRIKYSATVGGDSGILDAVADYEGEMAEIRAVINGTLNYIGERLANGATKEEVYSEVTGKGFAEPGARNFEEVIDGEMRDVLYKAVILANYSKLFNHIITPTDVEVKKYVDGRRCSLFINKDKIMVGFISIPAEFKFPKGINNCLYINNQKIIEGPGAGGRATAERMFKDFAK